MKISWTLDSMPSQAGKRFLITGGNSGIGYYTALELTRRGALVLLACRDRARGEAALARLRDEAGGPESRASEAEVVELDLGSLESVKRLAEQIVSRGLPLHGLINNAGVMAPPKRLETKDGFELQFGTNVLGHFALTCGLMPALSNAGTSRVVTVASIAHKDGQIAFDDLQSVNRYSPMGAYRQSKLANLMFAIELERRLREAGSGITSIAVHPGVAETKLFKVGSGVGLAATAESVLQRSLGILFNSGPDGALPTLFAATAPEAKGGCYYGPQGFKEMRGGDVGEAIVARQAQDQDAQRRLWGVCEELTGLGLRDETA